MSGTKGNRFNTLQAGRSYMVLIVCEGRGSDTPSHTEIVVKKVIELAAGTKGRKH